MKSSKRILYVWIFTLALHGLVLFVAFQARAPRPQATQDPPAEWKFTIVTQAPARPDKARQVPSQPAVAAPHPPLAARDAAPRTPASMAAPAPPTAQEWALAAKYTLKNSKRYRYNWGQQVRSMMGTAVEGPDQGVVRLHVEIAADGRLEKVETLWSTSPVAEKLAHDAVQRMPPLPPTPDGKPLIFETTIAFQPFDLGWPPIYKYDCLPDPPKFRNPFVWDGKSPQAIAQTTDQKEAGNAPSAECLSTLPEDTPEAESADMDRQLKQWGSRQLDSR